MGLGGLCELVVGSEAWSAAVHGVTKSQTWLSDWTELNWDPGNSDFDIGICLGEELVSASHTKRGTAITIKSPESDQMWRPNINQRLWDSHQHRGFKGWPCLGNFQMWDSWGPLPVNERGRLFSWVSYRTHNNGKQVPFHLVKLWGNFLSDCMIKLGMAATLWDLWYTLSLLINGGIKWA